MLTGKSSEVGIGAGLVPPVESVIFTLENGLELIVLEDHSAPVASLQAWVRTGSIHEGRFMGAGISHLVEHLLFKGTDRRSCNELAQQVQNVGGYINAYTSFDRTVYWMDLPSKGVPVGLDLLADAVFHSRVPAEEYAKEQEVIRREFAMGEDNPDRVVGMRLFANAYRIHPYRHPVIGHLQAFNALSREDVLEYYGKRYVPNNVFFVVSGDVDPESVREQLAGWVSQVRMRTLEPVWVPQEPLQIGRREVHDEFATELTRLHMAWHIPEISHGDIAALDLLASVLGQGRSSRLYRRLREEEGLVHSVSAWTYSPSEPGLFGVDAVLDPQRRELAIGRVEEELDRVRREGIREEELEKVRKMALSGQIGSLMTAGGRASDVGGNWLNARNVNFSRFYLQQLQRVTVEEVRDVVARYLTPDSATVVSLNPKGSLAKRGQTSMRAERGEIRKGSLSNGLRTLVCEDAKLPMVTLCAVFKSGVLTETEATAGLTRLFSKVLIKGTASRSAEQIAETLESRGGEIGASSGNNSVSVSLQVLREDLRLAVELLADVLRNASFPAGVVEREKQVQLAAIKAEEEQPVSVAGRILRERLLAGHPYALRSQGTPESVAGLSRECLLEHRERYLVGRNGVVAVFGDVQKAEVDSLLESALGGLPEGVEALCEPPIPPVLESPIQVDESMDKQQAVLMVGYRGTDIFSADRTALDLLDEACSDLGSRMFVRIREQLGLAYFVGSSQIVGLSPGAFLFYLGTDPMKKTAVLAELCDEIRQLSEGGLELEELERAKEKFLGAMEIRNQSLGAMAMGCALDELYGLGAEHFQVVRERVRAMTLEEVREVAGRYFGAQPAVVVCVGPGA